MKNKTLALLVLAMACSSLTPGYAKAESLVDTLKSYGIPCAISIGLSAAFVKNDGVMIGSAICAGMSASTYLNKVDDSKLKAHVELAVVEHDLKIKEEVNLKLEEIKSVLRELLAERLVKMEEDIKVEVEKKIQESDFMARLESKLSTKIKEEVVSENNSRRKEIISQAVEEVIRQVVAKPIAAPNVE